jgi:hypothetical protein
MGFWIFRQVAKTIGVILSARSGEWRDLFAYSTLREEWRAHGIGKQSVVVMPRFRAQFFIVMLSFLLCAPCFINGVALGDRYTWSLSTDGKKSKTARIMAESTASGMIVVPDDFVSIQARALSQPTRLGNLETGLRLKLGDLRWNPNADIDNNNVVGLSDLIIMANHYGQRYP